MFIGQNNSKWEIIMPSYQHKALTTTWHMKIIWPTVMLLPRKCKQWVKHIKRKASSISTAWKSTDSTDIVTHCRRRPRCKDNTLSHFSSISTTLCQPASNTEVHKSRPAFSITLKQSYWVSHSHSPLWFWRTVRRLRSTQMSSWSRSLNQKLRIHNLKL